MAGEHEARDRQTNRTRDRPSAFRLDPGATATRAERASTDPARRRAVQFVAGAGLYAALISIGLLRPGQVFAQNTAGATLPAAFNAKTLKEALAAMGAAAPAESADIRISAPEIAENGAVVPVVVNSALPGTEQISILTEKNPLPLAGTFFLLGVESEIGTRIKMSETSDVYAVVKAGGKFYMARKEIKVTLGGCGG